MTDEFDYEAEDEFIERDDEHPGKARVADLRSMNDEILNKHRNTMLKGINASLADGKLSEILDLPILTEQLLHTDIHVTDMKFYNLNRTDMLADIRFWTELMVMDKGKEISVAEDLGCTLWFSFCKKRISCVYKGTWDLFNAPARQMFPELSPYLSVIVEKSVKESRADQFWMRYCKTALNAPYLRTPETLAAAMGLQIDKTSETMARSSCLYFRKKREKVFQQPECGDAEIKEMETVIPADTIIIEVNDKGNSIAPTLDLFTHCVRYEYQYKFFMLQGMDRDALSDLPKVWLPEDKAKSIAKVMREISSMPVRIAYSIMLPHDFMSDYIRDHREEAAKVKRYLNYDSHSAARLAEIGKMFHNDYPNIWCRWIRARMLQLGHTQARGIFNSTDGHWIDAFGFSDDELCGNKFTLAIGYRDRMLNLFYRDPYFRKIMETGDYVFADGLIVRNQADYVMETSRGARPTPKANKQADSCSLRFSMRWIPKFGKYTYRFGKINYDLALQSQGDMNGSTYEAEQKTSREQQIARLESMPTFHEALADLVQTRSSVQTLAWESMLSKERIKELIESEMNDYWPDEVFALCVGLHLEPYLSYPLLKKAKVTFQEDKDGSDRSYRRAMLCCLFKESVPQICRYIATQNARQDTIRIPELLLRN